VQYVLDCSLALSWYFDDEVNDYAVGLLKAIDAHGAIVPVIWPLEIANSLLVAERRGRIKAADSHRILRLLEGLPIYVEESRPERIFDDVVVLGRQNNLSAYDASYLDLAMREGLPLATLDKRLQEAAGKQGVPLAVA
jgi:predicted nucleic acid-binding protein